MGSNIAKLVGTLAIAGLVTACSGVTPAGSSAAVGTVSPSASADTTLVADLDVGGRTMHIVCVGPTDTGRPTVIFEHGLGGDFRQWGDVLTPISATDRGCSYDRAGMGLSEPATTPRTTADQVDDLRALLKKAGVAPPYIVVGYSLGGWNAIVHAESHPDDIVGAVLVEVRPPEASRQWLAALPPETPEESDAIRQNREEFTTFEQDPTRNPEGLDIVASALQAAPGQFGSDPLVVLVAIRDTKEFWEGLDPELATTMDGIWLDLQRELAARSTAGRLEMVEDATHELPGERPDAVVDAIKSILAGSGA